MSESINLRTVRKAKAREAAERLAEVNRARHGRTKAEVQAAQADTDRARRRLDASKREPSDPS